MEQTPIQILDSQGVEQKRKRVVEILKESAKTVERIQGMRFIRPIERFKKTESGKVAILCNGPSVYRFDPAKWGDYPIIGMNGSWRVCMARYHIVIDVKQFREWNAWWMRFMKKQPAFKHLIVGLYWDEEDGEVKGGGSKYHLWRDLLFESATEIATVTREVDGAFSLSIDKYGAWMPSTPMLALQFAVYAGFEEIHFFGLDLVGYKFFAPRWKLWRRFMPVGKKPMNQETALVQNFHFHNAAAMLRHYKPSVRIYNHNPDSLCSAFEKVAT